MKPKISFDFDNTLEYEEIQRIAKDLITQGYNVCILTTRYSDPSNYSFPVSHSDLYGIAHKLGIEEINFTEYQWKTTKIDELGINIHIDDNYYDEVEVINSKNKAKAILYCHGTEEKTETELYKAIAEFERS